MEFCWDAESVISLTNRVSRLLAEGRPSVYPAAEGGPPIEKEKSVRRTLARGTPHRARP